MLIFPEGTRTLDGEVAPLKPGFASLARRGRVPLLPMAIDGAFDAWPRKAPLPRLSYIRIVIDRPLMPDEIERMSDDELIAEMQARIGKCHAQARHVRSGGRRARASLAGVAPAH